jgi:transposase InsO family protein
MPVAHSFRAEPGEWVWLDGHQYEIRAQAGDTSVRLISPTAPTDRRVITIPLAMLISDPTFRPCTADEGPSLDDEAARVHLALTDTVAAMDGLARADPGEMERLADLQGHMLELTTGYRSGDPAAPGAGEPREGFDPSLPMRQRVAAKAAELGVSADTLWYRLRKWRAAQCTTFGLVDRRSTTARLSDPLASAGPRVIEAITAQHGIEVDESTGDMNRFKRRVQNRLDAEYGKGEVRLPEMATFRRWTEAVLPGKHTTGSAVTRRTTSNRPEDSYEAVTASRVGEVVMLDTTRLDVLCYDPVEDITYTLELTIAIDVASRVILAWRFKPEGTKAADAGALIGDAMTPEPMRPGWPDKLRHATLKLACEPLLSLDERFAAAAARPVVFPEKIIIDHGKAFASQAVKDACRRYGISIQDARAYRATDKPQVEAAFKTIRSGFSQHVAGYKGYKVDQRGRQAEQHARWTLSDIEFFFAEYVISVYQRRHHTGLVLPGFDNLKLSPNDAYRILVHKSGYVACPADPNLYLELLPIQWLTIQHYGIQHNYLQYRAPVIKKLAGVKSPYLEMGGKWPIRVDPSDVTQVYFHDPYARPPKPSWHVIPWIHALKGVEPFTDTTLREVKKLIIERGGDVADQKEIAQTVIELQNRTDAPETWLARTRKARLRDSERARASALDRARTELGGSEADTPADPGESTPAATAPPALRAVRAGSSPSGSAGSGQEGGEEFDIDFDTIPTYEVWGAKPVQRPSDDAQR